MCDHYDRYFPDNNDTEKQWDEIMGRLKQASDVPGINRTSFEIGLKKEHLYEAPSATLEGGNKPITGEHWEEIRTAVHILHKLGFRVSITNFNVVYGL